MRTRPGSGSPWRSTGIASETPCVRAACRSGTRISPPPPAARRGTVAARQAVRLVGMPLDPHHRQNDHVRRLGIGVHITAAAERAMPFWKLHDNSHAPPPPAADGRGVRAGGSIATRLKAGMVNAPLTGTLLQTRILPIVVSVPMTEAPIAPELSNPELNGLVKLSDRNGIDIRPTLLRVVTDLYLQKPVHTEEESQRYERLALKLIEHVDAKTRATIAQKI